MDNYGEEPLLPYDVICAIATSGTDETLLNCALGCKTLYAILRPSLEQRLAERVSSLIPPAKWRKLKTIKPLYQECYNRPIESDLKTDVADYLQTHEKFFKVHEKAVWCVQRDGPSTEREVRSSKQTQNLVRSRLAEMIPSKEWITTNDLAEKYKLQYGQTVRAETGRDVRVLLCTSPTFIINNNRVWNLARDGDPFEKKPDNMQIEGQSEDGKITGRKRKEMDRKTVIFNHCMTALNVYFAVEGVVRALMA